MDKTYEEELKTGIQQLQGELAHQQTAIAVARDEGDTKEYTKLMSTFLATQRQYLKLCSELEELGKG